MPKKGEICPPDVIEKIRQAELGEKNHWWKGDKVKTDGLHAWVRKYHPAPALCEECQERPPYDLANVTGVYARGFENWKYLCRRCHIVGDGRVAALIALRRTKRVDMSARICEFCRSSSTPTNRENGRPHWYRWDGKMACSKCATRLRRAQKLGLSLDEYCATRRRSPTFASRSRKRGLVQPAAYQSRLV